MSIRRFVAIAAAGVMAATGVAVVAGSPAGAGDPTNWPVDAQVKVKGDAAYSGIEIFGDFEPGQSRSVFALPGETALFRVKIKNTKFQNNRVVVFEDDFEGFIRIKHKKVDVTDEVFGSGYRQKLGPRDSFVLKVKVRGGVDDHVGIILGAVSLKFPGGTDYVLAEAFTGPPDTM